MSTAEKAREIAMYSRFPPVGKRGLGSPFVHGTWGLKMEEYVKAANDHVLVMVQIETKEGVQNIDKIVDVDGIGQYFVPYFQGGLPMSPLDAIFIGPYDLSLSLGYPPPSPDPHPDVEQIIQRILKVTHGAGRKWY